MTARCDTWGFSPMNIFAYASPNIVCFLFLSYNDILCKVAYGHDQLPEVDT